MGTVWRATDLVLAREVAVKVLTLRFQDDPGGSERFRREARILARLSHPRLGGVHDYGEDDGRAYTVMEFLTGETLQRRLARLDRIPPAEAAEIAAQVAEGLHAAHQAGVIHRDVKPANILLADQGVKLVDFGIALGTGDDRLTVTGTLVGSATYLSPERGTGSPASPASDIYSLGAVLYQMLAGRPPFTATDPVELVSAHSEDPVPPLPADVPDGLAQWCIRAMAKDPMARPRPALVFAGMLRESTSRGRHAAVGGAARPAARHMAPPAQPRPEGATWAASVADVATWRAGVPAPESARPTGRESADGSWPTGREPTGREPTDGSWPPTATLPTIASLPTTPERQARGARWRRWWLPATAGLITVIAGILVTGLVVTSARSGTPPARSHGQQAAEPLPSGSTLPAVTWLITAGPQPSGGPSPPPLLAPSGTTVRLAETLHNHAQQPLSGATFGLSAPPGWTATPEKPTSSGIIRAGGTATVTWRVAIPAAAHPGRYTLVATAHCTGSGPCSAPAVAGNAIVPYASFSRAFNNVGAAPQANSGVANLDGTGQSYSADALAAVGYLPGAQVAHGGISFAWPAARPGTPDNVTAQGQTFLISATGPYLAFLGASDFGSSGGDGIIYYTDGTQQSFRLVMDDWWTTGPKGGQDEVAVTVPQFNGPPGQPAPSGPPVAVYFAAISLRAGKTVQAVTLPTGAAPANGTPCLHLFAVAVG